ncbi:lipocalin family protein [Flavobacterium tegetincola]|uniref:lipocalin family protein n=1 Tax=Flavobacterium tegetincola TaxID=150172 RepID=UPI00041E6987|nr:lipocalin family protein [Flavobacterium tegetincola]
MKNTFFALITAFVLLSCQDKKAENFNLDLLNGYWEIEEVTLADGSKKEYKMNENIDFFEIKSDSGFRKKVTPQFDGTYLVNDADEKIKIEKLADGTYISYKTAYATWKEKIVTLSEAQLILENKQQIKYQYKKPIPFTIK